MHLKTAVQICKTKYVGTEMRHEQIHNYRDSKTNFSVTELVDEKSARI